MPKRAGRQIRPPRGSNFTVEVHSAIHTEPSIPPSALTPLDDSWLDQVGLREEDEIREEGSGLEDVKPNDTQASVAMPTVDVRAITDEDLDRLWDWIRTEEDRAAGFFGGTTIGSARQLYGYFAALPASSIARAITTPAEHIGIVVLHPVHAETREAGVSIYIAPGHRGHIQAIIAALLHRCDEEYGFSLVQVITDPVRVRLWEPFGFKVTYVLHRAAPQG